jgi:hypothetical protein
MVELLGDMGSRDEVRQCAEHAVREDHPRRQAISSNSGERPPRAPRVRSACASGTWRPLASVTALDEKERPAAWLPHSG